MDYSLYLVTDEKYDNLINKVEKILMRGVNLVQYRAKHKTTQEMFLEAQELKKVCDKFNVPLLINDRIDIALAVDAAGVHLGQDDLPCQIARKILGKNKIIGVSVHNILEAQKAEADGANYLGVGAIFPTTTKTDVSVLGLDGLKKICQVAKIPVVGIGGIDFENKDAVFAAGASGVAMVSAFFREV